MKQSKFDIVMDYIDENIKNDTETIKRGIINLIGINSNTFGQFFTVLTGDTLGSYIRNRRLFFAAIDLLRQPQMTISDIALEYGYSDQSAFTRAVSGKYKMSPNEIRTSWEVDIPNEKYLYSDFDPNPLDSRSDHMWREFECTGFLSGGDLDFIDRVEAGHKEFGFDINTCYLIADLAERLEIPVAALMSSCFDVVTEVKSDPAYISNKEMAAIDLGICSHEELDKICEHYACQYYELNSFMVKEYYSR